MNQTPARATGARLLVWLLRAYRAALAPAIGSVCRFHPTCSHYAQDAICEWGSLHGIWLTFRRVARCHPFSRGGFDPAPLRRSPRPYESTPSGAR